MFDNLWVEKFRPSTLDDIVLTPDNRAYFEQIRVKQEIPNLLFSGVAGIGKSSLAKILVNDVLDCQYLYINASDENGIDTIRSKVFNFAQTMSLDGKLKVVILDECDGLTFDAQKILRNSMEEYASNTRFIMTCNYPYKVIKAIKSRCQEFDLTPPFKESVKRIVAILKSEGVKVDDDNKEKLVELVKSRYPDIRKIINTLQKKIIDNKLVIGEMIDDLSFAQEVFNRITNNRDVFKLRKYIIQNEIQFDNDYHQLLKNVYEVVYEKKLDFNLKRQLLLCIGVAMYQNQLVLDAEINCYNCFLSISEILDGK